MVHATIKMQCVCVTPKNKTKVALEEGLAFQNHSISRRAAAGIRSKLLAKRLHTGGHGPSGELENVGKANGSARWGSLYLAPGILAKFRRNFVEI